jgi:hypothetical protein
MNMQTIQIMILLLDNFIKLAPWRLVTEAIRRIDRVSRERFARGLRFAIAVLAGLGLIVLASIFGPAFVAGYIANVMPQQASRGGLVLDDGVSGLCVVLALWVGVWWCGGRSARRGGDLIAVLRS